jgi:hypothetical protein
VRRLSVASLDSGAESPVYGTQPSASADRIGPDVRPPGTGRGGRCPATPTVCDRAVTVALSTGTPANGNGSADDAGRSASGFPVTLGRTFAECLAEAHRNGGRGIAAQRARELGSLILARAQAGNLQFNWNGSVTSVARSAEAAGKGASSSSAAVITVLPAVNGKPRDRGVPRRNDNDERVVSAEHALLPASPVATLPSAQPVSSDQGAKSALASELPGYLAEFASGDQAALSRYLEPGASVGGLGGTVSFGGIASIEVPQGGSTRDLPAGVNGTPSGQVGAGAPRLATTHDMPVVDRQSGRWYVKDIRASAQPMGTPMTWFASPWAVPRGPRPSRTLTDVHGREG